MSRTVSMGACVHRGEGATETEIEVEVEGTVEPYFGGSWDEPPSGGGVEDLVAYVAHDPATGARYGYRIELTEDEEREFAGQLAEQDMDYEPDYDEPEPYHEDD